MDEWNKKRLDLLNLLKNNFKSLPYYMGYGVPLRTPSYILGYQPNINKQQDGGNIGRTGRKSSYRNYRKRSDDDN